MLHKDSLPSYIRFCFHKHSPSSYIKLIFVFHKSAPLRLILLRPYTLPNRLHQLYSFSQTSTGVIKLKWKFIIMLLFLLLQLYFYSIHTPFMSSFIMTDVICYIKHMKSQQLLEIFCPANISAIIGILFWGILCKHFPVIFYLSWSSTTTGNIYIITEK